MKLFWAPEAIRDREEIYDYIALDNPFAALELDEMFSAAAEMLLDHPLVGRPGRVVGTMELVVHSSYMLVYEVGGDQAHVLAVVHTARRWPPGSD